jgi:hypothetical protein
MLCLVATMSFSDHAAYRSSKQKSLYLLVTYSTRFSGNSQVLHHESLVARLPGALALLVVEWIYTTVSSVICIVRLTRV